MIRFDPYAVFPPRESWDYVVDDIPIVRDPVGSPRLLVSDHSSVRLAPDAAHRSWRNEYVLVHEEDGPSPILRIRATLYLLPRGAGADLIDFEAWVQHPVSDHHVHLLVTAAHLHRARIKVAKVMDWYRAERLRRDRGETPMLTARELWGGGLYHHRAAAAS